MNPHQIIREEKKHVIPAEDEGSTKQTVTENGSKTSASTSAVDAALQEPAEEPLLEEKTTLSVDPTTVAVAERPCLGFCACGQRFYTMPEFLRCLLSHQDNKQFKNLSCYHPECTEKFTYQSAREDHWQ